MKTDPTTPPPVSEERNAAVPSSPNTDARLLELKLWLDGLYNTSANLNFISIGNALCELLESRTTIAALRKEIERLTAEHDRRGTSVREYMDMCEEYSASVAELTDLLTRVRKERDGLRRDAGRQRPDQRSPQTAREDLELGAGAWLTPSERALRKALAFAYSGSSLYGDDGELQDSRFPFPIDYMRDSVDQIQTAIYNRGMAELAKQQATPSVPHE